MHRSGCYEQQVKNTPQKTLYRVVIINIYSIMSLNQHLLSWKLKQNSKYFKLAKCHWIFDLTADGKKKKTNKNQLGEELKPFEAIFIFSNYCAIEWMVSNSKHCTNNEEILCISQTDQSAVGYLYDLTQ